MNPREGSTHRGVCEIVDSPEQALIDAHSAEVDGDLQLAESILRNASKKWRSEPEFKMRHGRILRSLGNERKALKVYRSVLKAHPQRSDAAVAAAETATSLNKLRLAESLWGRALAVGADTDLATVGLCRIIWNRGRKEEAWQRAYGAFIQAGSSSKKLHDLMQECSPIIGMQVPEIDLLDTSDFDSDFDNMPSRRELPLQPTQFSADSVEAMAGITADELTAPVSEEISELLGETVSHQEVDLTAIDQAVSKASATTDVEIPDDLLDFD